MPLYFFDLNDGVTDTDDYGSELPNADAARAYALKLASIVVGERPRYLSGDGAFTVSVRTTDRPVLEMVIRSRDIG